MGKNDIDSVNPGSIWPIAPREQRELGVPLPEGQRIYGRSLAKELDLATLWRIAWEWRWLILGSIAVGLAGAVIASLLTTPLYRATATLEINPPAVEVMENTKANAVPQNDPDYLPTQVGLLQSRSLAERVAQELNLTGEGGFVPAEIAPERRRDYAVGVLANNLDVKAVPESRLIRVSFSSPDPATAARVVNGFADGFISASLERRYQASSYARDFLQRQIATTRRELENSERQLVAYAQQQGIINTSSTATANGQGVPGDTSSITGESLVAMNQALAQAEAHRIDAEQQYRSSLGTTTSAEVNERTEALRTQRAQLQAEYQQRLNVFQPDYPEMVSMRARIQALDHAIQSEGHNVLAGRSGTLRQQFEAALRDEQQLRNRVSQLRGEVLDLRGRSIRYTILQRDVDTNRALYDALLQRYKEVGVAGGVGNSHASVVDRGEAPTFPYKPDLILNLLIGLGLGLAAGVAIALVVEFVNDTIKTPDDVRDKLRLPFLGGIPAVKGKKPIVELEDASSAVSEAYFSTVTALQFSTDVGAPPTLLITSTRASEGKSTTTWAICQHLARLGKKVLLVDADMRKPAFSLDTKDTMGLARLLTNREPLMPNVLETEHAGLWILPCGVVPPNAPELLASPRLNALLVEARSSFDVVVVDAPPILGLADAPLLSSVCAGTLLVIESGKTRTKAVFEALNRLRAVGTSNIVGAILTRYRHESTGYGYNYEAYNYSGSAIESERKIRLVTKA